LLWEIETPVELWLKGSACLPIGLPVLKADRHRQAGASPSQIGEISNLN